MYLSKKIINQLVEAGKLKDDEKQLDSVLFSLKHLHPINCGRPAQWKEIAQEISIPELINLNKGLTRAEYFHNWAGGSAAAVIWTFRVVGSRCPELADGLADWILQRTKNPYLPYGSDNLGATSFQEYLTIKRAKDTNYLQHLKREQKSQELSAVRRVEEQRQRAKAAEIRNTEYRQQFLKELSQKPLEGQLWQLAKDAEYPVTFYPTCLAGSSQVEIFALNIELRQALREKLKIKCRGPWAKFKRRLNYSFE